MMLVVQPTWACYCMATVLLWGQALPGRPPGLGWSSLTAEFLPCAST